jgi:hypothetical protein
VCVCILVLLLLVMNERLKFTYGGGGDFFLSDLDIFVVLIYPRNVNVGHLLNEFWDFAGNRQDFARQLCSTNLAVASRNHRDLLGLRNRSSDLGDNL